MPAIPSSPAVAPWLNIDPLAGVGHFLTGFQAGERAASQQASRAQEAQQFSDELAFKQDKAQADYQATAAEQKARAAQTLAANLLRQQQLNETMRQHTAMQIHQKALEEQAQRSLASLEQSRASTESHQRQLEKDSSARLQLEQEKEKRLSTPKPAKEVTTLPAAERSDLNDINSEIKKLEKNLPDKAPGKGLFGLAPGDFNDYASKTNRIAELHAKKAALLNKYRSQKGIRIKDKESGRTGTFMDDPSTLDKTLYDVIE